MNLKWLNWVMGYNQNTSFLCVFTKTKIMMFAHANFNITYK